MKSTDQHNLTTEGLDFEGAGYAACHRESLCHVTEQMNDGAAAAAWRLLLEAFFLLNR